MNVSAQDCIWPRKAGAKERIFAANQASAMMTVNPPRHEGNTMATKKTKMDIAGAQKDGTIEGRGKTRATGNGHSVSVEHAAHAVKEGIVNSLSGLKTIEGNIADLVRKTVSDALRTEDAAVGELVDVVHHVVMGAIGATEQVGTGLTVSTKSVAKGIVMGVHDVGGDVVAASFETVRSVIRHAAKVQADLGIVAKRAVDGVIEATVETGGNVAAVGRSAIEGAIDEAGNVSNMAVKTVKDVLINIAGSLGQTIGAALPHASAQPQDTVEKRSQHVPKNPHHH
jgi:hypothetical protein